LTNQHNGISGLIDRFTAVVGRAIAWLTLLMVLTTFVIVVMRYAFDVGLIWLQESLTWMHAMVFMLGAAYTLERDEHVRVDVFYREMTRSGRAWVNLLGALCFLLPLCGFVAFESYGYVMASWQIRETSMNSGGLPYPAVPLLKSALLVMPMMVGLQGLSIVFRSISTIRGR